MPIMALKERSAPIRTCEYIGSSTLRIVTRVAAESIKYSIRVIVSPYDSGGYKET